MNNGRDVWGEGSVGQVGWLVGGWKKKETDVSTNKRIACMCVFVCVEGNKILIIGKNSCLSG